MIKKEDLKKELLVWWTADRLSHRWSCPAIVTVVGEDYFQVQCLDDFENTVPLSIDGVSGLDESVRIAEMRICTLEEARDYFNLRTRNLEDDVTKKDRALKDAKDKLTKYNNNVKTFLAAHS